MNSLADEMTRMKIRRVITTKAGLHYAFVEGVKGAHAGSLSIFMRYSGYHVNSRQQWGITGLYLKGGREDFESPAVTSRAVVWLRSIERDPCPVPTELESIFN